MPDLSGHTCLHCHNPFLPNKRCRRDQKFCSPTCRKVWWNDNIRPKATKKVVRAKRKRGDLDEWFRSRRIVHVQSAAVPEQREAFAWLYAPLAERPDATA